MPRKSYPAPEYSFSGDPSHGRSKKVVKPRAVKKK